MRRLEVVRNMAIGATSLSNVRIFQIVIKKSASHEPKRRQNDVIVGNHQNDPFFDSYKEVGDTLGDMIELIDRCEGPTVNLFINKNFLKNIIQSHIHFIQTLEREI